MLFYVRDSLRVAVENIVVKNSCFTNTIAEDLDPSGLILFENNTFTDNTVDEDEQISDASGQWRYVLEGGDLHACGHEVLRRELAIIPAQVRAVEHVQTVYSCRACEKIAADDPVPMVKSSVPTPVIQGSGIASPSLLAYILCNKYVLALPLNRQEQEFERLGIYLSRQTMANWIIYAANHWMEPIHALLKAEAIQNDILHADETTVQVIKDGRASNTQSYMWLYRTTEGSKKPTVLFEYQPTRSSIHPLRFLSGYDGYLQVDGYQGYHKLEPQGVTIVECWSHARRKFHDALKALDKADRLNASANTGYEYCNRLFALEKRYDVEKLPPEQRFLRRLQESKPIAEQFFDWTEETSRGDFFLRLPKSAFGHAITYAKNQREWLMNVYLDGRLSISNNIAERSIRPFTIGRNNWLFAFSPKGAESSAIAYSIVETAIANNLVPLLYVQYLFEQLPNLPKERFGECLPWADDVQLRCNVP
jgi:transposase